MVFKSTSPISITNNQVSSVPYQYCYQYLSPRTNYQPGATFSMSPCSYSQQTMLFDFFDDCFLFPKLKINTNKMSEKQQFIEDGIFNDFYFDSTYHDNVLSYFEVDLGELNLLNTRTNFFKKNDPSQAESGSHSDLEWLAWKYHREIGLTVPVLTVLEKIGFNEYTSSDQVVADCDLLFPKLLKKGYFLQGTNSANLFRSIIPSIDHADFEFFFAAKLFLTSKKLSRIDSFLDFQMKAFVDSGRSTVDFKRFVRLCLREYEESFGFSEKMLHTVNEWLEQSSKTNTDKRNNQSLKHPEWNKGLAILAKTFLKVPQDRTFIISSKQDTSKAFAWLSGYSKDSINNQLGKVGTSRDYLKSDFNKALQFLKSAINELETLADSTLK